MTSGLKSFLVPTDFSVESEAAVDVAVELASEVHAKVHLMHAVLPPYVGLTYGMEPMLADIAARMRAQAEADLAACLTKHRGRSVELAAFLQSGDPRDAVLAAADEVAADLVIMGTRGRRGLLRTAIGSVAESVVRSISRPVMTVHGPREVAHPFRSILVATDFSEPSRRALDVALDLARISDASVTLLHVWSPPKLGYVEELLWPLQDIERAARSSLEGLLATTAKRHGKTEALLRQGDESTQILETSTKIGCDLVVMGTHGRRGLPRLLLGSVAGEIIRTASVPVLTVGLAR